MVLPSRRPTDSDDGFAPDDQQATTPDPYAVDATDATDAFSPPKVSAKGIDVAAIRKNLDLASLPRPITFWLDFPAKLLLGRPSEHETSIRTNATTWLLTTELAMQRPLSGQESQRVAYHVAWGISRIQEFSDFGLFAGGLYASRRAGGSPLVRGARLVLGSAMGFLTGKFISPFFILPLVTWRQQNDPQLTEIFKRFLELSKTHELEHLRNEAFSMLYPNPNSSGRKVQQLDSSSAAVASEDSSNAYDDASPRYQDEEGSSRSAPAASKEPGSAWERLRKQQQDSSKSADRVKSRSNRDGDGVSINSETDKQQQDRRSEAQKDFDARLERERHGKDFDDSSSKRW
jgi:hypothetical protein